MNQETRESLSFVIGEMTRRAKELFEKREGMQLALAEIDGELLELNRRLEAIKQDMAG